MKDLIVAGALALGASGAAHAQRPTGRDEAPRPIPRNVLGGIELNAADSAVATLVGRLELESYKGFIKALTEFGDREQGTERNARAVDWIEAQFRTMGYETGRIRYEFQGSPREEVYATKVGASAPGEMVLLGAHMDGRGGGEGANDNASGSALVLEIARVLAGADVQTGRSARFALWNNEETGLNGARAYAEQRAPLQGIEEPAGSGRYPEPRWIASIHHDKVLWDHGNPVALVQSLSADVDVEYQLNSKLAEASASLGIAMLNANRTFATDYPAVLSNSMSNTDSTPFMDLVPSVSVRENRRLYEIGRGSDPRWHQPTDLFVNFSDDDFKLGLNAAQTTLGATARLVGIRLAGSPASK